MILNEEDLKYAEAAINKELAERPDISIHEAVEKYACGWDWIDATTLDGPRQIILTHFMG